MHANHSPPRWGCTVPPGSRALHLVTSVSFEVETLLAAVATVDQGTAAYVYPEQVCGSIPLYGLFNSNITDHFYTTNETEREDAIANLGYADQGIACYVLPA